MTKWLPDLSKISSTKATQAGVSMTIPVVVASAFALLASLIVAAQWIVHNPHISGWDQIQYIDLALRDDLIRRLDGAGALRDSLFGDYRWMPPGVRLLAMPLVWLQRDSETAFRWFTMALFLGSLAILFDAARRLGGIVTAAGATSLIAVCPVWVRSAEDFMSETALIPAMAVLLWCLVRECEAQTPRYVPLLSGLALGFGLLSRFSFAPMAVVVLTMLTLRAWRRERWTGLLATILTAAIVAWPFYAYDGARYLEYGRLAATWPLDQLPGHHLTYVVNYMALVAGALGLPVLLLLPVVLFPTARNLIASSRMATGKLVIGSPHRFIGIGCGLILLLTVLPHIFGHNQNPRYLLGMLPVLAIFLASGCRTQNGIAMAGAATVQALVMLFVLFAPSRADTSRQVVGLNMASVSWRPDPTCDWSSVVRVVAARSQRPTVRFFGITDAINHVQIQLAFLRAGVLADVIPVNLSKPEDATVVSLRPDAILILDSDRLPWTHPDVPDPNLRINALRDVLLHDKRYTLSSVRVGGVVAECGMSVFLPSRTR